MVMAEAQYPTNHPVNRLTFVCVGQEGYFRIARGVDESHVESLAVAATVLI